MSLSAASAVAGAARTPPRSCGQRSSWADSTVFRVEGSQSLQVLSEYLGIDPTAEQLTAVSCC